MVSYSSGFSIKHFSFSTDRFPRMLISLWLVLVILYTLSRLHPVATQRAGESDYFKDYYLDFDKSMLRVLQGKNKSGPPARTTTPEPQINVTRLFRVPSHAPDVHRDDIIAFKFNPCARSVHIESASLVFGVHSTCRGQKRVTNNDQSGTDRNMVKNCRLKQKNQLRNRSKSGLTKLVGPDHNVQTVITSNNTSGDIATRKSLVDFRMDLVLLDESKVRSVIIIVRVVNTTTDQKRNIAMQEIHIRRTSAVVVSVPTKYLKRAALADDHTLTLQIVCIRCGHCAWVESIYMPRQNSGKKEGLAEHKTRKFSLNRPQLTIRMKNSTCTDNHWINFRNSQWTIQESPIPGVRIIGNYFSTLTMLTRMSDLSPH